MENENFNEWHCAYSDLPSPMAYVSVEDCDPKKDFSERDVNRIIEMAWEDRTPFDAIKIQFGLNESDVKAFMKKHLRFNSYIRWRKRVENCSTKHKLFRNQSINRFKCSRQRQITQNRISKQR